MSKLFKRILVPIDFTEGSTVALKRAISLAEPNEAAICLLYICRPLFSLNIFSNTGYIVAPATEILTITEIKKKVERYTSMILERIDGVVVETVIAEEGKKQGKIEETANLFGPDLIVLCKNGDKRLFPFFNSVSPEQVSRRTDCPVLTIKQGSDDHKIKNIILPVTRRFLERKLEIAIKIARAFKASIHLITFPENETDDENSKLAFIESFNRIRENASLIIKHGPVMGNDIAKSVLRYTESVKADLILVNPITESSGHSFIGNRHISDMLPANSQIQILDVQPYSYVNLS